MGEGGKGARPEGRTEDGSCRQLGPTLKREEEGIRGEEGRILS